MSGSKCPVEVRNRRQLWRFPGVNKVGFPASLGAAKQAHHEFCSQY